MRERYTDAYRVADAIVGIGSVLKWIGGIGAGILIVFAIANTASKTTPQIVQPEVGIGVAVFLGGLWWAVFFVSGVLVSAQGQILRATLDTAVNTTPLSTSEPKDRAAAEQGKEVPEPLTAADTRMVHCQACGNMSRIPVEESRCPKCGRKL